MNNQEIFEQFDKKYNDLDLGELIQALTDNDCIESDSIIYFTQRVYLEQKESLQILSDSSLSRANELHNHFYFLSLTDTASNLELFLEYLTQFSVSKYSRSGSNCINLEVLDEVFNKISNRENVKCFMKAAVLDIIDKFHDFLIYKEVNGRYPAFFNRKNTNKFYEHFYKIWFPEKAFVKIKDNHDREQLVMVNTKIKKRIEPVVNEYERYLGDQSFIDFLNGNDKSVRNVLLSSLYDCLDLDFNSCYSKALILYDLLPFLKEGFEIDETLDNREKVQRVISFIGEPQKNEP